MDIQSMIKRVEALRTEQAKLEGQMEQALEELKREGYNNLAEAEAGLKVIEGEAVSLQIGLENQSRELEQLVNQYESVLFAK